MGGEKRPHDDAAQTVMQCDPSFEIKFLVHFPFRSLVKYEKILLMPSFLLLSAPVPIGPWFGDLLKFGFTKYLLNY